MRKQKGFTLIEIIIVIIVVGIIIAGSSNLLSQGFRSYMATKSVIDTNWQNTVALETMTRDLRAIRSSSDITAANSTSITFNATTGNTVTYTINGASLGRTEQSSYQPVADNFSNLTLQYYDSSGATANTSNPSTIRYIIVNPDANYPTITVYPYNMR
jgi:prepilin-type N-terminal cleavage/methylation domain-containing protein